MNFGTESVQTNHRSSNAPPQPLASLSSGGSAVVSKMASTCRHQQVLQRWLCLLHIPLLFLLLYPPPQLWQVRCSSLANAQTSVSSSSRYYQAQQAIVVGENQKLKSAISELLQSYATNNNNNANANLKPIKQTLKEKALLGIIKSSSNGDTAHTENSYKCAKYCTCSVIQVLDRITNEHKANLTQASCESHLFADVLTIDRRTQIIHISLPMDSAELDTALSNQQDHSSSGTVSNQQDADENAPATIDQQQQQQQSFRMPRLVQFDILREIVIINLKLEVCDSEVFKKGQRLRRFQLNHNQLRRISKVCLKHLEKLIELNLDFNELAELESALFSSLLSLRSLSIAHNRLSELAAHQFANLTNLVSLNLVGNKFKTINLHLFEPMQSSLRLLLLAKNQIKSFVYAPIQAVVISRSSSSQLVPSSLNGTLTTTSGARTSGGLLNPSFVGAVFKHLIKLNVDQNRIERIKLLQLHRFFNVKFLSIRQNNLATIRDKAFNGLKLIELNLANNQLQSVSKCAFCNATIRRLVLSHNNITMPLPSNMLLEPPPVAPPVVPRPLAVSSLNENGSSYTILPEPQVAAQQQQQQQQQQPAATSSQNMLILSQSIFGPLFGQLEYLDLSYNERLADQLEYLLEPLLKLEYLNLASVGLDRSLPSPSLFKNLRQLRYLNLSHNQLDQVIAETIEPLAQLEALDLSDNKFSELDESFLVTVDDLSSLKLINLASNPWYCSQCKVAPLYDWILRSPIYNTTCIAPAAYLQQQTSPSAESSGGVDLDGTTSDVDSGDSSTEQLINQQQHDYSLLVGDDDKLEAALDFDLVLGSGYDFQSTNSHNQPVVDNSYGSLQLPALSFRELSSPEDDPSIALTIASLSAASEVTSGVNPIRYNPLEYCLKCEFPHELHTYNIHDLSPADFKFCAGAAPRFAASEPKIGLTLAIVIIGALFCIIVVVIVMYRRKSNTYYTNEDTDQLNASSGGGGGGGGVSGKKQLMSISSDVDHQYDATDYSSPPMSQSYDESYTHDDDDEEIDDDEEEDEEELDEDEEYDDDQEINAQGHNNGDANITQRSSVRRQVVDEEEQVIAEELGDEENATDASELRSTGAVVEQPLQVFTGQGVRDQTGEAPGAMGGSSSGNQQQRTSQEVNRYTRAETSRFKQSSQSFSKQSSPSDQPQPPKTGGSSTRSQRQSSATGGGAGESLKAHWADQVSANSSMAHTEPPTSGGGRLARSIRDSKSSFGSRQLPPELADSSGQRQQKAVRSSQSTGSNALSNSATAAAAAVALDDYKEENKGGSSGRGGLSLSRSVGGRKRAALENSQTLYHLASGLRPQGNVSGSTRSQSSAGSAAHSTAGDGVNLVGGEPSKQRAAPMGTARRPNFSQLGQRRKQREKSSQEADQHHLLQTTNSGDLSEPEVALQEPSRRGELQQMAHLAHVSHSPSALSDATTADSLALEPLEYLAGNGQGVVGEGTGNEPELCLNDDGANEDEELQHSLGGGVLELDASSLEPELELELQRHLMQLQPNLSSSTGNHQRTGGSTHSALTQTGSRDD